MALTMEDQQQESVQVFLLVDGMSDGMAVDGILHPVSVDNNPAVFLEQYIEDGHIAKTQNPDLANPDGELEVTQEFVAPEVSSLATAVDTIMESSGCPSEVDVLDQTDQKEFSAVVDVRSNCGTSGRWDDATVSTLLTLIRNHDCQSGKKAELWDWVQSGLMDAGHAFNKAQCHQKWRNMVRGHRNHVRNCRKESEGKWARQPHPDFFKEIGEILAMGKVACLPDDEEPEVEPSRISRGSLKPRGRPPRPTSAGRVISGRVGRPCRSSPRLDATARKQSRLRNGHDAVENGEAESDQQSSRSDSPIQVRVVVREGDTQQQQLLSALEDHKACNARNTASIIKTNKMLMKALRTQLREQHQEEMLWRERLLETLQQRGQVPCVSLEADAHSLEQMNYNCDGEQTAS